MSALVQPSLALSANGHQQYLSLAGDGTHLYFEDKCYGTVGFAFLCYVDGDAGAFALNLTGPGETPSLGGPELYDYFHGFVTADAGSDDFVSRLEPDGGFSGYQYGADYYGDASLPQAVFMTRQAQDAALNTFGPQPLALTSATSASVIDNPVTSVDERTLYMSVTSSNQPIPHIYVAERSSTSAPFGDPTPHAELDSPEGEYPTWISPDACRLYFTRTINGQTDLFVATR